MFMYALSLDQPFAHMIVHLKMNVESRTWSTERRGTIAIHATAKKSKHEFDWVLENFGIQLNPNEVDRGAIVGFADLVDVITEKQVTKKTAKWFIGPVGYILENIVALKEPVPTKGNRKFWRLKGDELERSLSQLSVQQRKLIRPFEIPG
ncbi:MAG: hypothetical protein EOP05_17910 [Proteobacteria bacterium]|nr:MAG: hypothetical protein EOP05_17910 [Pseudomonadota bacterium]